MGLTRKAFTSKVSRRMFFLFLFCAIVPVCALAYLSFTQVYDRLEAETFRKLRYSSKSAGYVVYSHLAALEERLLSSELPASLREDKAKGAAGMPLNPGSHVRPDILPGFRSVASCVPGPCRVLLGTPPDLEALPPDIMGQLRVGQSAIFALSNPHHEDPVVIMASLRSAVREKQKPAVVYGEIDLQALGEEAANVLPPDTDLHIFGPSGKAYYSLPLLSGPTRSDVIRGLEASSSGTLRWRESDTGMLAMYWSVFMKGRFLSDDWIVLTATSEMAAFAPMREFRWTLSFILLLTVLLVALLSTSQIRQSLVPLARLKTATREISRGDFGFRVDASSQDEFGELAESFNLMAEELAARESQLEDAHVALVHSEKLAAFGQLGAGIAHEVKNPLAGILAVAQLSMKRSDPGNPLFPKMALIEKETVRCKEIIDNLLRFARQDRLPRERVCMNTLLRDAVRLVEHQLRINNVRLELEPSDGELDVIVSPNQVQQVIMNLAMNAQESMESRGGTVWIASRPGPDHTVEVVVRDNGPGIAPDVMPNIFNPFFTTKPLGKGTGLGLSVSYGILRDHGGTIHVESAPGQGTTFVLSFPRAMPGPERAEEPSMEAFSLPSGAADGQASSAG